MISYTSGRFKAWDDAGVMLVTGRVYTYTAGTTTLKNAFTSSTLATPATYTSDGIGGSYIALNARGEAEFWLGSGLYDIVLKTAAGATIWTAANQANDGAGVSTYMATVFSAITAAGARATLGVAPRATRIDIASVAGTVDLTTNAPDTDDIRITGALAITAFTVAVGRVIRFTAGGAFSFANNASIVTQTGATVTFASGDTGILRATTANVVELLALTRSAGIYFSAYQTTLTSAATGAFTKIALQAEEYDVGAAFDSTTNSRWTPGRIGLVHLSGGCLFSANLPGLLVAVYKNGALYKRGEFLASGAGAMVSCDAQVTAITDYFELFIYHEQGGAQNTTPSQTGTYFQGHMVAMA